MNAEAKHKIVHINNHHRPFKPGESAANNRQAVDVTLVWCCLIEQAVWEKEE